MKLIKKLLFLTLLFLPALSYADRLGSIPSTYEVLLSSQYPTPFSVSTPSTNETLLWNGTNWVNAAQGATFSFSVASFSDGNSSTVEIGTGVWLAAGNISFTATYNNGPPTSSTVTTSGWSALAMTNSGAGPTSSAEAVNYPSVAGTVIFTLTATTGSETDSINSTHTFVNRRFWGVSTTQTGFTEANVEALANSELSNSKSKTFTVSPGSGEYIVYAYPSRLGTATAFVNGFEGGFNSPETVSITNTFGYAENFYVYSSVNSNLGSTTVEFQ